MLEDPTLAATDASVSTPAQSQQLTLRRGDTVGRFVVIDQLGRGAMGTVYAAFDVKLERQVALKLLHRSDRGIGSLLAEAQALARVNHPNVVTVYDVGEHQGRLYLAMELVEGRTLRRWQADEKPDWRDLLMVYRGAARGLEAVHRADLVHGDFKPDNVMVADDGRVLVMDFGIARSLDTAMSEDDLNASHSGSRALEVSRIRGTPAYMAPEQFRLDGVGPASDQFAFSVALHEALWGERPFEGETLAELSANVALDRRRPRASARAVPRWVALVIDRGLSADADDRYPSMASLDEAFDQSFRRRMQAFSLAGAIGLTAAIGAAIALSPKEESPCEVAAKRLDAQLGGDDVATLRRRIGAIDHDDGPSVEAHFNTQVEAFAEHWHEANAALCRTTNEDPALSNARRRCLEGQRDQLEVLVSVYNESPTFDLSKVSNLASALPRPSRCTELEDPRALEGTGVESLILAQQALARARALADTGRVDEGIELVDTELRALDTIDAPRIVANMNLWRASKLRLQGRFEEALASTKAAQYAAARSGADDLPCLVWLDRTYHAQVTTPNATEVITALLEAAEFALLEAGNPPRLRIRYLMRKANAEFRSGQHDAAIADLTEALALTEHAPPRKLIVSNIHNLRGLAHINAGHTPQAHQDFRAAHDVLEQAYGPHHPVLAQARANLGAICMDRGDADCAQTTLEKALRALEAATGQSPTAKAALLTNLSDVLYQRGDVEASRRYAQRGLDVAVEGGFDDQAPSLTTRVLLLRALRSEMPGPDGDAIVEDMLRINELRLSNTPDAAQVFASAAEWFAAKGNDEASLAFARKAQEALKLLDDPKAPALGIAFATEAAALASLDRLSEASETLDRARAVLDAQKSPETVLELSVGFARAKLLLASGQTSAAGLEAAELVRASDRYLLERKEIAAWMEAHGLTAPPLENAPGPPPTRTLDPPVPSSPG